MSLWNYRLQAIRTQNRLRKESSSPDIVDIYHLAARKRVYSSLPSPGKGGIRLLNLQPGAADAPLECTLAIYSLSSCPQYEALSYTWSRTSSPDTKLINPIRINGILLYTLPNLGSALRTLRHRSKGRMLWVDYLCINQDDSDERTAQVQHMGDIFNLATRTVIFLGADTGAVSSSLDILSRLTGESHCAEVLHDIDSLQESLCSLARILSRAWFERVWTLQEVVRARDAVLVCGDHSIPWNFVQENKIYGNRHADCCTLWLQNHPEVLDLFALINSAGARFFEEELYENLTLPRLLIRFNRLRATDPRDYIFPYLGLLPPEQRLVAVDYGMSAEEVFKQATIAIVRHEQGLGYLTKVLSGIRRMNFSRRELPSWAVDPERYHVQYVIVRSYELYNAAGDTKTSMSVMGGSMVKLRGKVIDTVEVIDTVAWPTTYAKRSQALAISSQPLARKLYEYLLHIESIGVSTRSADSSSSLTTSMYNDLPDAQKSELVAVWRTAVMSVIDDGARVARRTTDDDADTSTYLASRQILEDFASKPEDTPIMQFFEILHQRAAFPYALTFTVTTQTRRFFMTENGRRPGMGDLDVRKGDKVAVLQGGKMPFLIRRVGAGTALYTIVGTAYVDGLMDGEAVEGLEEDDWDDIYLE